jgi:Zn-dependent protease
VTTNELLVRFLFTLPLLLVSLACHELAHAWVADSLGDPTPRQHGRLSLNPIRHLDVWGTALLVISFAASGGQFFFGYAKPVPVFPWNFKDPQRGEMLVSAAGPGANFALAALSCGAVWLTYRWSLSLAQALVLCYQLNIILGTFNLLPIPGLDGGGVVGGLLPRRAWPHWLRLARYGSFAFFGLFIVLIAFPGAFDATIGAVVRWSYTLLPGG